MQHPGRIASPSSGSPGQAVELLSALLLHHSPKVRRSALTAAVACCKRSLHLGTAILAGLQMWLREGAPQAILQDTSADDAAPSPSATAQRCHRVVASLAAALTSSDKEPSAAFFARLLQLGTHPLVTVGVSYRSSWAFISRSSPSLSGNHMIRYELCMQKMGSLRSCLCLCPFASLLWDLAIVPKFQFNAIRRCLESTDTTYQGFILCKAPFTEAP